MTPSSPSRHPGGHGPGASLLYSLRQRGGPAVGGPMKLSQRTPKPGLPSCDIGGKLPSGAWGPHLLSSKSPLCQGCPGPTQWLPELATPPVCAPVRAHPSSQEPPKQSTWGVVSAWMTRSPTISTASEVCPAHPRGTVQAATGWPKAHLSGWVAGPPVWTAEGL